MELLADLHLHSKYSRACSKDLVPETIAKWAKIKGVHIVGTGDFTHPLWFKELKEKLEPLGNGFYHLRPQFRSNDTRKEDLSSEALAKEEPFFVFTSEISCIYSKGGRVRRVHVILVAPSLEVVEKINAHLGWQGNLKSDGRPILGMDVKELTKIALNVSPEMIVIPSHIWTPWFSLFGSMSGFDSVRECFEEYADQILAAETGLSSDPAMNWRLSQLDNISIASFSDAHSPRTNKFGREATAFQLSEPTFQNLRKALNRRQPDAHNAIAYTIEFFPEEGKYHYDGHRLCGVSYAPEETARRDGICEKCGKRVTIGVMNRVQQLADRPVGFKPADRPPFYSLIPLSEIIAEAIGIQGVWTKNVDTHYHALVSALGDEFAVLVKASRSDVAAVSTPEIAEGILRSRAGRVRLVPGYDGEYGKVKVFAEGEAKELAPQRALF